MARNTERERNIKQALRQLKQSYRRADSAGERFERELNRLKVRKTLIEPEDVMKLVQLWETWTKVADDTTAAMTAAVSIINY